MRDEAYKAVKIIELVRRWFDAPFPKGWDQEERIESYGKLVQQVEDLMNKSFKLPHAEDKRSERGA